MIKAISRRSSFMRVHAKRYMTILESLIAMFLLSILLVLVFGLFRELSFLNGKSKIVLKENFQQRYVESRLATIFSDLVNENISGKVFYFFTVKDENSTSPSLLFTFNNGSSWDSHLAEDIIGRLFVDDHHRLCLALIPIPQIRDHTEEVLQEHIKIEYLLENVHSVTFKFLAPPYQEQKNNDGKVTPMPKGTWEQEWLKEYNQMPVIVKIELQLEKKSRQELQEQKVFSFVLPSSKNPVIFTNKS